MLDVAVERGGRADEAWGLAVSMGVSLTDIIECGDMPPVPVKNKRIVKRYSQDGTRPATELTEGIGGWRIGVFIVS